ncbi:MAG: hypothetical protein AB7D07_03860 [Desulfovibrionaceae bacterium]
MKNEYSLELPESYRFYMQEQNSNALDRIAELKTPPPELPWEKLKDFYHAQFSMQVIQFEYYLFVYEAWRMTWGAALKNYTQFSPMHYSQYAGHEISISPECAFRDAFGRLYSGNECILSCCISIDEEDEALRLYWRYKNVQGENLGTKENIGGVWELSQDESWSCTKKELCPLSQSPLDLSRLYEEAARLLKKI